jgi:hypothetical protein
VLASVALWVVITHRTITRAAAQEVPSQAPAPPAPPAGSLSGGQVGLGRGEIDLELESFGVGNIARPSDWIGIRVRLKDTLAAQRNVIVRLSSTDSDGDSPQPQVEVTLNPGTWQGVWLYTRMQSSDITRTPMFVTAYEAIAATDLAAGVPKEELYRAGRMLARIGLEPQPSRIVPEQVGLIGMVGNRALGLRGYSQRMPNGEWIAPRGHEVTDLVDGLLPVDLPDRWMGLASFDALVWGSGDIADLRSDRPRARALVDWVQRGGHLIVVLPPVGQNWTSPDANPVYEIMPAVVVERIENASMLGYRPLLTNRLDGPFPKTGVVHTFGLNANTTAADAIPILNGPDGKCVVVRRLVGAGAVTLIGLDLNQTPLAQFNLVDADIFWHRVLGRRGNLGGPVATTTLGPLTNARSVWYVDDDIAKSIAVTGKSAVGALVGFAVFAMYWLFVGPPMFFVLKKYDRHRFAWLGFALGTAVFTVLAWGAATLLRPSRVQATHLTIMDHVYGQNVQRARMWASVLVPKYGVARLAVDDPSGETDRQLSAIAPWDPAEESVRGSFPDARGYPIDARSPDAMTVPVRATVKQVQCDWAGSPRWDMIRPVQGATDAGVGAVTLTPEWRSGVNKPLLTGFLSHNLPGPLRNAQLVVVRQQSRVSGNPTDQLPIVANAYALQGEWNAGDVIDLSVVTNVQSASALDTLVNSLVPKPSAGGMAALPGTASPSRGTPEQRILALAFMSMLKPPEQPSSQMGMLSDGETAALRRSTHGWDLSRWMAQPCVIIIGTVGSEDAGKESPVPIFADGVRVPTSGVTVLRWVYPLPARAPEVGKPEDQRMPEKPKDPTEEGQAGEPLSPGTN